MTQERAPASLSATSTGAVNCTEFNWAVASWCLITLPVVKSRRRTKLILEKIQLTPQGDLATITLIRPEAGNALSHQMASELKQVAESVDQDTSIRAVVMTGAGKHFCFGGDLKEFVEFGPDPKEITKIADQFHAAQHTLLSLAKPLILSLIHI